ncbi:MAG: NAD(P)-binding protein [Proteobacteria bacterium]|nr:NAD(P)-binding protein [Pseudomonadota bacterium]
MKIFVIGAGPTGLSLVDGLSKNPDIKFEVIEADSSIGGLAKTVSWKDHGSHDLGPHKIFTLDQILLDKVIKLLPEKGWIKRPKKSSIYMNGRYIGYPPSPFALLRVYGIFKFVGILFSFAKAKISSILGLKKIITYEDDIKLRVGNALYSIFFRPIAIKLWGNPKTLDINLSKGRVQTPSILEVIAKILGLSRKSKFEALEFLYPKGGLQKIWDSIYKRSSKQGKFSLNEELFSVSIADNRIKTLLTKNTKSGEEKRYELNKDDFVFSTVPVKSLIKSFDRQIFNEAELKQIETAIVHNDLVLVFIKTDKADLLSESWVFIPELNISYHRLSEQESFDPDMSGRGSIVCCEIMSSNEREFINKSDEELLSICLKGLNTMGYMLEVKDFKVQRLYESYPVYRSGYKDVLQMIIERLDSIDNLRTIGRQGAFNYIGTIDAMDIGYGSAKYFIEYINSGDKTLWQKERNRTKFFPVLD